MDNIYKVERKNGKCIFTKEQKEKMLELYNNPDVSTKSICEMFGISKWTLYNVLTGLGVQGFGGKRKKYELNENYFDEIDSPKKAYILGFLYADGYNSVSKRTITMSLEERDKDILEAIRTEIGSTRELEYLDYSNKHDFGYTYSNQYRLLLFSAHMSRTLESYGMVQNKSLVLSFPNIREDLLRDFIRGYYDGDGSVYQGKRLTQFTLTITSTNDFCEALKEFVENKLNINCHIYDASNHNGITKVFNISGRIQITKFLDWLYQDAEMFLTRKYNRYIQYFYATA